MPNAVERAYETVLSDILSGVHPVGGRLREEELASSIGISRTPVREALRRLHAEGLVEVVANRGAMVVDLDSTEVDDIFELRVLLEGYAARQAAVRASAEDVAALEALCNTMEQCTSHLTKRRLDEISKLNLDYHRALHEAAANRRLVPLLASLMVMPLVRHTFNRYSPDELARSFRHHRELIDAIRARNPDWAEAVMRTHVSAARSSLHPARSGEARARAGASAWGRA